MGIGPFRVWESWPVRSRRARRGRRRPPYQYLLLLLVFGNWTVAAIVAGVALLVLAVAAIVGKDRP